MTYSENLQKRCGCHVGCHTDPHECEVPCKWPVCLTPEELAEMYLTPEEAEHYWDDWK